ncbi:hypothetical protein CHS0354_012037 [Potamilus streckersoni]|uniref:G-protein coupled receptors family 1 profile domain-containing protein n=1 Tax=Potamilus streckersoni TaxID=2493646 RepID=A0AAE0TKM6_9BIVA|nr:hypothetical protein CHS0354_012037 [Potamilus streckersoni]
MAEICQEFDKENFKSLVNLSYLTAQDLTEDVRRTVLPLTIFIMIEAAFGFFGNVLILYVYFRKYPKCNFRTFILFLSFTDLTSCVTTLPGEAFTQWNWYNFEDYEWICKTKSFFNVYTACNSGLALLFLAFDRYRKVCRPLEWQIRPSVAVRACIVATGLSAMVASPFFILWGAQQYKMETRGVTVEVTACEKDERYENTWYPIVYTSVAFIAPVIVIMMIASVLSILVVKKIFCKMNGLPKINGRWDPNAKRCNKYSLRKTASEYRTNSKTHLTESFCCSCNGYSAPNLGKGENFTNLIDNGHEVSVFPRVQKSNLTEWSEIRTSIHTSLRKCRFSLSRNDKQHLPEENILRNDKRHHSFSSMHDFCKINECSLDFKGNKIDSKTTSSINQRCLFYLPDDGTSCDLVESEHSGPSKSALHLCRTRSDADMTLKYYAFCLSKTFEISPEIVLYSKRNHDQLKEYRCCTGHLVFKQKSCPSLLATSDRDMNKLHKTTGQPSGQFSDETRGDPRFRNGIKGILRSMACVIKSVMCELLEVE